MECSTQFLAKNRRYRILYLNETYYIIDLEASIWPIFIPFLFWLMPHKIYKVDFETVERLKEPSTGSNNLGTIMIIGIGGSAVLSQILQPILDFSFETMMYINVMIAIIFMIVVVLLKSYFHKSSSSRLSELVDLKDLETMIIKVKPKFSKQLILPIVYHLLCLLFLISSLLFFIVTSNFIGVITFVVFLFMLLFINTTVIHPNLAKTSTYRLTLKN